MTSSASAVHQITQLGTINAYLVQEDDGLTLIDALMPRQQGRILRAAEALGAEIVRVTITHSHPDHVGSLNAILKALPDAEFIVAEREAKTLQRKPALEPGEPTGGKLPFKGAGVKATPTRLVNDGDTIGSLQVVAAPGHSIGHVAFLDPRDGTLICGDVYSTVGGVATTAGPYRKFPLPGLFTWHRPTELESARRLRALNPTRLAPGHGKIVPDPAAAMDRAIAAKAG